MTLFELYNRSNVSYYKIEYDVNDLFSFYEAEDNCRYFLSRHYTKGKNWVCLKVICMRNIKKKENTFIRHLYFYWARSFYHVLKKK